eukprot:4569739-Prymnesium_polylepis.1
MEAVGISIVFGALGGQILLKWLTRKPPRPPPKVRAAARAATPHAAKPRAHAVPRHRATAPPHHRATAPARRTAPHAAPLAAAVPSR